MVRPLLLMGLWLLVLGRAWAVPAQLIRPDEPWRYLALSEQGPPEGWEEPGFDDSAWAVGPGGFSVGFSGYLQGATVIPSWTGRAYVRGLVLRRSFVVERVEEIRSLILRAEFEDGLIVWLNGQEVVRRGLPSGAVPRWDMAAESHPLGEADRMDLGDQRDRLRAGTNWLALQVFDASSFGGTVYAWPELRANFARGPWVQNVSSNRFDVVWTTAAPVASRLELRAAGTLDWRRPDHAAPVSEGVVEVSGLGAGERYEYRVVLEYPGQEVESEVGSVRTLRPSGEVDFVVIGDTGASTVGQYEVGARLFEQTTDLVLHVGDIVYPNFTRGRVDLRCLSEYEPSLRSVPWFFTMGNHDVYAGEEPYLETFRLPRDGLTGGSRFYSFDHGEVHFVSLFVPWWGMSSIGAVAPDGTRSAQYRWLTNDLVTTGKRWKVVFFHQPPLTSGPHGLDDYDANGQLDTVEMKRELVPLLSRYGVHVVFNGHDHSWERFAPTNGTHYVVTGGGGAFLYPRSLGEPGSAQFSTRYHWLRVRVRGSELTGEAVGTGGEVFDRFTVRIAEGDERELSAPWVTRSVQPEVSNGDGNVVGETFDLPGPGMAARTVGSANLGRLVAAVDTEGIRLGLREVMIWPGQTIALLIGTTNSVGAGDSSSLGGLGGVGGPALGSVRLAFERDPPAMVALVGDEYADEARPEWVRPGTSARVGQGVYRWDGDLSPVAGARLRQFNRSPEAEGVAVEQSADYIVVSLPWGALPEVWPGDRISVRAVVLTPSGPGGGLPLELDASYLGVGWTVSPDGFVRLGAVTVALAEEPSEGEGRDRPELSAALAPGGIRIGWRPRIGRRYEVERAERLPGPFLPMPVPGFPRRALGPVESVVVAGEERQAWYRVRALP